MEDASIVFLEALPLGHHAVQQFGARGKGADGSQQPAVPWKDRQELPLSAPIVCGSKSEPLRSRSWFCGPSPAGPPTKEA